GRETGAARSATPPEARSTMRGVVLPGDRRLEYREVPVPQPGPGQALVRVKASGLCGSDLRAIYRPTDQGHGPEAYRGVIAGHEPAGVIEATGPGVTRFQKGDRVIVYHIAGCGQCEDCRQGLMISCTSPKRAAYGWQRDGGHAPYLLAEESTLIPLPEPLTYVDGALAACGFGTAWAAIERARVSGRDTALITGLGPVGLALAMLSQASGARVLGRDPTPERRGLAKTLGVDVLDGPDTTEAVKDATNGRGVEVAFDASGSESARRETLAAARPWARIVWVGEGGTAQFEPSPLLIHKNLTLMGSWVCSLAQMEELTTFLVSKNLHPQDTVTHRYPLEEAREAYETFDHGRTGKVVLVFD
ncbi:MAG TPA: zinc-binding dehydrogenase, partial [Deinococcales bacterium]|nr:zinc-binding dehydrogenase [Deinococcales bacterium]